MSEISIYRDPENQVHVEVQFEGESFWLTQEHMAVLFERDRTVIGRHLRNIFIEGELDEKVVCASFAHTTKHGAMKEKTQQKDVRYYNLDAILSVGYRVNSRRGTHFRQWATQRLKDYLIKGFALNEKKLMEAKENFSDLHQAIKLALRAGDSVNLTSGEAKGILSVLNQYAFALETLDKYDHQRLTIDVRQRPGEKVKKLTYENAVRQIAVWKEYQNAGELFGNEKDRSFRSSLETIYQSINGKDLYPTIEEKAANLLYFIVKNHSFTDGNKRIAAGLFAYFMDMNNRLFDDKGKKVIGDNALVAITIMIAESAPAEKEMMVKLVVNLIINDNS